MGTVWLCRDERLGREVAVKQIGTLPGETAPDLARAMREARSSAALNHPHVVSIYDVVEEGGHIWLVMEYVASRTLAQVIGQDGPMSPEATLEIGVQIAEALASDPRRRHHPPRRQARQHPCHRRRRREDQRLRDRTRSRPEPADAKRTGHRDTDVLRAGARARREAHPGSRRLGTRRKPVRRGRGPSAVRGSAQRPGTAGDDRVQPADAAATRGLSQASRSSGCWIPTRALAGPWRTPRTYWSGCGNVIPNRPCVSPPWS